MPKRLEEDFDNYLDTVEMKNWLERARREMFPKLAASAMSLMIINSQPDPKLCLELGAAILSGRVDYARALDPGTYRKAQAMPALSTAKFYQSVIHAVWINNKRKPFDDPRVRRAVHLLCDRQVLVDVVKGHTLNCITSRAI